MIEGRDCEERIGVKSVNPGKGEVTVGLALGITLLAVGFVLRSQPARLLALGVVALTVAKVFIIDTASIAGIYRALSSIGLGVVLLGIGWLYQRMLYPRPALATGSGSGS